MKTINRGLFLFLWQEFDMSKPTNENQQNVQMSDLFLKFIKKNTFENAQLIYEYINVKKNFKHCVVTCVERI